MKQTVLVWTRGFRSGPPLALLLLALACSGQSTKSAAPSDGSGGDASGASSGDSSEGFPCLINDCEPVGERAVSGAKPTCPDDEPEEGASCSEDGLACTYGNSPSSYCRHFVTCTAGAWQIPENRRSSCATQPASFCPPQPEAGAACRVGGVSAYVPCEYEEGVLCYCLGNPVGKPGASGQWDCYGPPASRKCPAVLPNLGEGCSETGVTCHYGVVQQGCFAPYADVFCYQGAWQVASPVCLL